VSASLLTSPVTGTDHEFAALVAGLVPHSYASADDVEAMTATLRHRVGTHTGAGVQGQRYYLHLSPGVVRLSARTFFDRDEANPRDRRLRGVAIERGPFAGRIRYAGEAWGRDVARQMRLDSDRRADELDAAIAAAAHVFGSAEVLTSTDRRVRRVVKEWSRASRRRMTRRIGELDLSTWEQDSGVLAMLTLTLPDLWEAAAPTGPEFKALVDRLRKRWLRAVGPWRGLWKLEFQGRGAPHMHMLMRVPAKVGDEVFERWLARTWADVVLCSFSDVDRDLWVQTGEFARHLGHGTDVSFSGVKFSDPRRTAVYFLKHAAPGDGRGSKEYQHIVPEPWQAPGAGPGRFWGYWGLRPATDALEVDHEAFLRARRILRHVARARVASAEIARRRHGGESVWTMARPRPRVGFGASGGGWVLVNDGLALAWDVGRALALP
jgi:hypothetical protein